MHIVATGYDTDTPFPITESVVLDMQARTFYIVSEGDTVLQELTGYLVDAVDNLSYMEYGNGPLIEMFDLDGMLIADADTEILEIVYKDYIA